MVKLVESVKEDVAVVVLVTSTLDKAEVYRA
jgi:hypothetical protein